MTREEALKFGQSLLDKDREHPLFQFFQLAIDAINSQTNAEWVKYTSYRYECSNCKTPAITRWSNAKKDTVDVLSTYCPYCGARMFIRVEGEE